MEGRRRSNVQVREKIDWDEKEHKQGSGTRRAWPNEDERQMGSGKDMFVEQAGGRKESVGFVGVQAKEGEVRETRQERQKELVLVHVASVEGTEKGGGLDGGTHRGRM